MFRTGGMTTRSVVDETIRIGFFTHDNLERILVADWISSAGPSYFLRVFFGTWTFVPRAAMLKCSSFLPDFSAAASHRGFSPRPAHVSAGFAGLRYFGATGPRTPPPFERNPFVERRSNLPSWPRTARRASITLELMTASISLLSFDSLSIDIDFRFMTSTTGWAGSILSTMRLSRESNMHCGADFWKFKAHFNRRRGSGLRNTCTACDTLWRYKSTRGHLGRASF
jgi:hypothetical protein